MLGELTAAGRPWLAIDMPGSADRAVISLCDRDVTVASLADPGMPPVMVNPLEPEPGFGVQAHARRLAELIEAVFGLAGPVAEVIRAGLLRVYADCGWDAVTGIGPPGAGPPPAVPAFAQLRHAVLATAERPRVRRERAGRGPRVHPGQAGAIGRARRGVSSRAGIPLTSGCCCAGRF